MRDSFFIIIRKFSAALILTLITCSAAAAAPRIGQRQYQAYQCYQSREMGALQSMHIGFTRIVPDGHGHFRTLGDVSGHERKLKIGGTPDWNFYSDPLSEYSLRLQVERGLLSEEERKIFLSIGRKLDTRQVRLYDMSEWQNWDASLKPHEIRDVREREHPGEPRLAAVRRASLWSVSGQILDATSREVVREKLAIEHHPDFLGGAEWDFAPTDALFEWGRAGQEEAGEFTHLAQLAALQNMNEVLALGRDPARAWVIVGSSDPALQRLYAGSRFEEFKTIGKNKYFRRKLVDIIEDPRLAPSNIVAKLHNLKAVAASHGVRLSEFQALDFATRAMNEQARPYDLEPTATSASPPLWLLDRSPIVENHFRELCLEFGVAGFAPEVAGVFARAFELNYSEAEPQLDFSEPRLWAGSKGLVIGGLDAWVKANPNVNPLVPILAMKQAWYDHMRTVLKFEGIPIEQVLRTHRAQTLTQFLSEQKIDVTVYFHAESLAGIFRAFGLPPEPTSITHGFLSESGQAISFDRMSEGPNKDISKFKQDTRPGYRLTFTLKQLEELEERLVYLESDRALARQGAQLGFWNHQNRLNRATRP